MKRSQFDSTDSDLKDVQSPKTMAEKKSRWDVREGCTVKSKKETHPKVESESDDITLDTKVACFICGRKGPLRHLTNHQMTAHTALQFIPPEPNAITCSLCNYAMPSASLERHLKRKHPTEYSKMQKQKIAQILATTNQPMSSVTNTSVADTPKGDHVFERVPKNEPVSKNDEGPKNEQQPKDYDVLKNDERLKFEQTPTIGEHLPKEKRTPKPATLPTQTIYIKTQSMVSVEEDDDGFFDLVITEFGV